ncbi:twin-arginine translocation signal domain-containing protein [Streptomyces pratensis]|nr:twin-arginine translocation signal domain-containing protein [Streptomyces pratensis]
MISRRRLLSTTAATAALAAVSAPLPVRPEGRR